MLSDTSGAESGRSFLALRGAITVDVDTAAEVGARTTQLLETLFDRNDLHHDEFVSVFFTATPDIRSIAPAVAARTFGLTEVPLICVQEMAVDGSLPLCVRILAHLDTDKSKADLRHVFLRGAVALPPEPAETGATFEENAYIKAHAAAAASGMVALSDDSGLCVDALDGQPGIHTADWAELPGGGRDFMVAMRKVEDALQAKGALAPARRGARFVAVLCLTGPDGGAEYFRGEVEGRLVWPPRGDKGFGYDPVFLPDGFDRTFGEMEAGDKHGWEAGRGDLGLSHRARAFAKFAKARFGAAD